MSGFDVAVVGLGAMGSAALYHLAARGVRVIGIDRFRPPHGMGSSHGRSRVIREAYFEHPLYVPLVRRSLELWESLNQRTGAEVYRRTGGLMLGPANGPLVSGSLESAIRHRIRHETWTAAEVRARLPGFEPPDDFVGIWEDRAGVLDPETAIASHLDLARRSGATLALEEKVLGWEANRDGTRIQTGTSSFEAGTLVLAVGAWLPGLAGTWLPLRIERQCFHWFRPAADPAGWPVALWEHRAGGLFATIPQGGRLKAGIHHEGDTVDPDQVSRMPTAEDERRIRELVARYQPGGTGPLEDAAVCLYTNTPDSHFIVDRHPRHPNVLLVSPCSGHGFKFSAVIGEIVADLVLAGSTGFDLDPFSVSRFQ